VRAVPDHGPAVGAPAPDFALRDQHGQLVGLAEHRGRSPVVIVFFPYAFTPTCTGELCSLGEQSREWGGVVTLGISCDPGPALRVFAEREHIDYPLLSDFWPHGAVARSYGVFVEDRGFATRGTFIVDAAGILCWKVVNSMADARSTEAYRRALAAL
jgi:mycoredoxin-dependent peroxiredoxin